MAGDVKVAVVSGQISTSGTGTADFTKSGFGTPKACIIIFGEDTSDNTNVNAQSRMSIGFSDFSSDYCIAHQDEDASAKVDCDAIKSNTLSYIEMSVTGGILTSGTASTITDGVRLTNNAGGFGAPFATVIMFGGVDLGVSVQSSAINSSQNGTATIAHSGEVDTNDKLIFFIGTDIGTEDNASTGINNSFGVCHATGSDAGGWTFVQRCLGWASDHGANEGAPSGIISTDRVLDIITEAGTQDWGLEVTALDHSPAQWTVTTRDAGAGAGMEVYSLALDLDDRKAKVGSVNSPPNSSAWTPSVSLGFTPQYVGLGLTYLISEDAISVVSISGSIGLSSNTGPGEETCHSWDNQFDAATTNTNNKFRSRAIDFSNITGNLSQDLQHSSFNSGGWTYTNNAFTGNRKWFYWTLEEAAGVGFNIAASVDALTLTENIANVNAETNVQAVVDALVLVENAAAIQLLLNIDAGVDVLTLTAQPAGVNAETNVLAGVSALALTEQPAGVNAETSVLAGVDTLSLAEQTAMISLGVVVNASTAALALSELAANVNAEANVLAFVDGLVLTSNQAGISLDAGGLSIPVAMHSYRQRHQSVI